MVLKKRNPKNNTVIEALANVVLDVAKTTTRATAAHAAAIRRRVIRRAAVLPRFATGSESSVGETS